MQVFIVSAFTDRPFTGNPAGVCLLDAALPDALMQKIARELSQPETAFVQRRGEGWSIRWFSPIVEVELCGHATLAAARVLWDGGHVATGAPITFQAPTATLAARTRGDDRVWLDFPALSGVTAPAPPEVLAAIDRAPSASARHGDRWVLEYADAADIRALGVDFPALKATGVRSLIVTARADMPGFDIVSRNFAPIVGVDEDQVTGMAHTCLAPYWRARLGDELSCWQASPRGGAMSTRLIEDRVELGGRAIVEMAGRWRTGRRLTTSPSSASHGKEG